MVSKEPFGVKQQSSNSSGTFLFAETFVTTPYSCIIVGDLANIPTEDSKGWSDHFDLSPRCCFYTPGLLFLLEAPQ